MKRFGLALSGGGFRACLYHLGVIRFFRNAGLLSRISHITSVSGGSVIAAHLVLNWDRYCGTDDEFQEVADELLQFLQLDVRNRIVRRFPFASLANFGRRTLRMGLRRQYTRAGLLEKHYEKHLYGDTGLFHLPESPRLYMLATNVNEGSISAFYRDGMLLQRRGANGKKHFEKISTGLATVPMAVAASSAFPGFFPPLELTAWEVGARQGDFGRLAFTDGGIYDNIGLRMFHHIQHSSIPSEQDETSADSSSPKFEGVFVSDAGATFKVRTDGRAGGLLSTAMRSSDILMDRVNQMELESFRGTSGALFFPITNVVSHEQDPFAPHPEVQRQAARIRTDMDRFSNLEISALVQHGYCVARHALRSAMPELVPDCPEGPAWNPLTDVRSKQAVNLGAEGNALPAARELRRSASRRIVSTLFSLDDWPTYLWVPILVVLLFSLPYSLYKSNKTAVQRGYVIAAINGTSPVYREVLTLIENGPSHNLVPVEYEEVAQLDQLDMGGFEVLSDNRIFDLRGWTTESTDKDSAPYVHSRLRIRRKEDAGDKTKVRIRAASQDRELMINCLTQSLRPKYRRQKSDDGKYIWEIELDLSHIPVGGDTEAIFDGLVISEYAKQSEDQGRFHFSIFADTGLAQIWVLMPEDRRYERFEISGYPFDRPDELQTIIPTSTVQLPIGAIATFQLINPKHDYRYECRWLWSPPDQ